MRRDDVMLSGSNQPSARFGSSIELAGDLNKDNFMGKVVKVAQHPWALFLKTFLDNFWTKYPMDLVRNVPGNSKITVLLQ